MSDFDDDDIGDGFFGSGDETPKADRPLGLIVPLRAQLILGSKGEVIYDELAEREREYRMKGHAPVIFEEGDGDNPEIGSQP